MSAVPHIVLTECLVSEEPVRDVTNDPTPAAPPPSNQSAHHAAATTPIIKEGGLFLSRPQVCHTDEDLKQEVHLLLTELEIKVLSPPEVQELSTPSSSLRRLSVSAQTKNLQLSHLPLLLLLPEGNSVRDAYKLLLSLLESSKPVPKPRLKPSVHSDLQSVLMVALKRGMETGERALMLKHEETPDVRRSTYRRLDSLEETIRELENTLIEISGPPPPDSRRPPLPPKPSSTSIQVQTLSLWVTLDLHPLVSLVSLVSAP